MTNGSRDLLGANSTAPSVTGGQTTPARAVAPPAAPAAAPPERRSPPSPASTAGAGGPGGGRPQPTGFWRTFDSLRDPNYRWFFGSMFSHFAGMNIQMFIQGYMVFQLTGSFAYLGLISVAQGIPMLLLAVFGGVIADQVSQKKYVVQVGQSVNALNAFLVAGWILTDLIAVEHLLFAAFVQGTVNSLMMPSRQALTPEVVGMERLTNALALSTAGMNFNRLVMPGPGRDGARDGRARRGTGRDGVGVHRDRADVRRRGAVHVQGAADRADGPGPAVGGRERSRTWRTGSSTCGGRRRCGCCCSRTC